MAKKVLLSIPDPILSKLENEQKKYAYSSLQEVIVDALRDKFYFQSGSRQTTKRGRPKKIREAKILTRKKIFSKKGEPISV